MDRNVIIGASVGFVVGGVIGYFVSREVEGRKNEHFINTEIQEANDYFNEKWRKFYTKPSIEDAFKGTEDAITAEQAEEVTLLGAEWLKEAISQRQEILAEMEDKVEHYNTTDDNEPEEVITVEEPQQLNIFDEAENTLDPTVPRLISLAEFMEDCQDYDKVSVTWFDGDGTMIDEKEETPIEDVSRLAGDTFMNNFGKNSGDHDTVYVRNNALEIDFEITRDPRTFEEWVLGPVPKAGIKKMRGDD